MDKIKEIFNQKDSSDLKTFLGMSKTVYAFYHPDTKKVVDKLTENYPHFLFEDAWTGKQEELDNLFFESWFKLNKNTLMGDIDEFKYRYPINGSSEGIRHTISLLDKNKNTIHTLEGEYEGYKAYADVYGIELITHNPNKIFEYDFKNGDVLYLSNPNALNGNKLNLYHDLMKILSNKFPFVKVYLDLAYVNLVGDWNINISYPVIDTIFFSLSKTYGVYYHRIGGMISKSQHNGLWGNKWFKNVFSIYLGIKLMKNQSIYSATKLEQERIFNIVKKKTELINCDLKKSDVPLLLYSKETNNVNINNMFNRIKGTNRYCISPLLYKDKIE